MINNYTVALCDIIDDIYYDDHAEVDDLLNLPSWKGSLAKINEKVDYANQFIFSFDYPYYGDADDKQNLERHIIKSYYTRNICCSSFARWQLFLAERLEDIMPRYVALYDAQMQLLASDLLDPYHIEESKTLDEKRAKQGTLASDDGAKSQSNSTSAGVAKSENTGKDNSTEDAVSKFSDTPQALMQSGRDYLTNMTKAGTVSESDFTNSTQTDNSSESETSASSESHSSTSSDSSENTRQDYTKLIKGNLGKKSNAELIKAYQDVILNIEELITRDLRDLFYQIY